MSGRGQAWGEWFNGGGQSISFHPQHQYSLLTPDLSADLQHTIIPGLYINFCVEPWPHSVFYVLNPLMSEAGNCLLRWTKSWQRGQHLWKLLEQRAWLRLGNLPELHGVERSPGFELSTALGQDGSF